MFFILVKQDGIFIFLFHILCCELYLFYISKPWCAKVPLKSAKNSKSSGPFFVVTKLIPTLVKPLPTMIHRWCGKSDRTLEYNGHKVYIFPDYTAEVMEQRRAFSDVMRELRELKVTHSLRFPARLRVQHNGQFKTFTDPVEAAKFVETRLRQE